MNQPIFAVLLCYGAWLSVIDVRTHRLPNRHVAAMTVLVTLSVFASGSKRPDVSEIATAAFGSTAIYLGIYAISRGQFGMGDVKYSFPLGMAMSVLAPGHWIDAILAAFAIAGLASVVLLATRRTTRNSRIAFGPYMTVGAILVALIAAR